MGLEIFTIVGPVIGLLVGIKSARLRYVHEQYEKLLEKTETELTEPDTQLDLELKKRKPEKNLVISLVSQISATKQIKKDIEESDKGNSSRSIYLDFVGMALLAIIGGVGASDNSELTQYIEVLIIIGAMPVILSVISFITHLQSIWDYKKKLAKKVF